MMFKKLNSYLLVALGSSLTACAFGVFVLPIGYAAGGVTGFAVLLQKMVPLPVSAIVLVVNLCLFAAGWFFVGRDFVIKTLMTSIIFPLALEISGHLTLFSELYTDNLMCALLAGAVLGLGCGLILLGNGSGGGFDILGVILNRKFGISISVTMYMCDFIVILTQTVSNGILKTVYGVFVILLSSYIVEKVLVRGQSAGKVLIFSEKHNDIRLLLLEKLDVGMTYLQSETGYIGKETKIIMSVVHLDMVEKIKRNVYAIDPAAFIVVENAYFVGGRGYTMDR